MSALPRYRTIKECAKAIKKIDGSTAITEYYIRKLCRDGTIIYRKSGTKSLVNLDYLLDYLGYRQIELDGNVKLIKIN